MRDEITLTAQTPEGFAVAHAGRELLGNNRAPYFTCGVNIYTSRHAFEIGAEWHSSGGLDSFGVASYFPQLVPLVPLSGAWTDTGEPIHGSANGWYWLGTGAALHTVDARSRAYGAHDPESGRVPDHREDPEGFMRAYVERAARSLRVSVDELPNVQDPELFAAWIDDVARPRWQAEADQANALLDELAATTPTIEEPSERSEEECTISLGKGDDRISVRAWQPEDKPTTAYREGVGWHFQYRVIVRACGTSYTGTYGGSVTDYEAGKHDARGACTCVLSELRDALNYNTGAKWAEEMGVEPDAAGYRKTVDALERCVKAAERMRDALEANADAIGD